MYLHAAFRLDYFVIGLTNYDPMIITPVFRTTYTVCAQYSGSVAANANATVICSPNYEKFRFVIVQGTYISALCLMEVYVVARCT